MKKYVLILLCIVFSLNGVVLAQHYEPNWESLDKRALPAWYDEAKFGIFVSWGLFSVPSFVNEWFWNYWVNGNKEIAEFMKNNYPPDFTYGDFGPMFTAEFFNADQWADLIKDSGAKYIVFITKHHDGFTLWNSSASFNWNSFDVGPRRDLVGEMARALKQRTDVKLGLYHSLYEWFNPLYLEDKKNDFKTRNFPLRKTLPELYELVETYQPEVIWSDGSAGSTEYWNSTGFLAWLYNESPVRDTVVVNDRWCTDCPCKHGGFYTCKDRYNPGKLQPFKWENCMTIDKSSWGFRREATLHSYMDIHSLIVILAETVSCGGNLLMNVGPTHDGRIVPIFEERLRQFGQWLKVNGEAIYASKPWIHQNDTITSNVWYTSKRSKTNETVVYAIVLDWPEANTLVLGAPVPTAETTVSMLGYKEHESFAWSKSENSLKVEFPYIPINKIPSIYAWVLKIEHLTLQQSNDILYKENTRLHNRILNVNMDEEGFHHL